MAFLSTSELEKYDRGYTQCLLDIVQSGGTIFYSGKMTDGTKGMMGGVVDLQNTHNAMLIEKISYSLTSNGDLSPGKIPSSAIHFVLEDGGVIPITKIAKDQVKPKEKRGKFNLGEYAEAITALAVFCKMLVKNRDVDVEMVVKILKEFTDGEHLSENGNGFYLQRRSHNLAGAHPDYTRLYVYPKSPALKALQTAAALEAPDTDGIILAAVKYANSPSVSSLATERLNGKCEFIDVFADGSIDEKGKKEDVRVTIRDAVIDTENVISPSPIVFATLKASLKYGSVRQFGQGGGKTFKSHQNFWKRVCDVDVSNAKENFDIDAEKGNWRDAFSSVYNEAYNQIVRKMEDDKILFTTKLANGIQDFATLGDTDVKMISLIQGDFECLNFLGIQDKFKGLDILVEKDTTQSKIIFKTPDGVLLSLRGKFENDGFTSARNYVEKGPVLSSILSS